MRRLRATLALLLAIAVPVRAETTSDPLWTLLSTYVLTPDAKAVDAQGEGDAKGLAALQADLLLLSDGFEAFRDEAQVKESLARLMPRMSPELKPFFTDRASSLDAVYRTMAVTDYTWASRFPDPPCSPIERRAALLESRDGLFQTPQGEASPWLVALLGPRAEGKSAAQALDSASAHTRLSAGDYERRRAQARKLTLALASEKAEGAARARLYCGRAAVYAELAAHHRASDAVLVEASRAAGAGREPSVFVVVTAAGRAAATMLQGKSGPVLVTDAYVVAGVERPNLFAYSEKTAPIVLTAAVVRRHPELGLAVLSYSEDMPRSGLALATSAPAKDDLVTALGHAQVSGLWIKTSGLVTKTGEVSFQTDAAVSAEMSGGPVFNEAGEVAGLLVGRPADTEEGRWPVAVPAPLLARWLDDPALAVAAPEAEAIADAGTAAILSRTQPAPIGAGLGAWNIPAMGPPPPTPRGVCVSGCNIPSAPSRSYSGGSSYSGSGGAELGQALGQAMAPVVQALVFQGIPALFRGIGSLFKKKDKSQSSNAPARVAEKKEPPKPPPSKCDITIESAPDSIGVAPVEIVAKVSCAPDGPLAGHDVSFSVQWDSGPVVAAPAVKTDSGGHARLSITLDNVQTKVAKTAAQAERSHDDLDRYSREMAAEEEGALEANVGLIATGDGTRALNTEPVKAPVAQAAAGLAAGRAVIKLTSSGRRLRVMVKVVRLARVARVAGAAGAPGSGGLSLGISLASTVLLFAVEDRLTKALEDENDCALKPGESVLDYYLDGTRLAAGFLRKHEGPGHTIRDHVGQSLPGLQQQLNLGKKDASSYIDITVAEDVTRQANMGNLGAIEAWFIHRVQSDLPVAYTGTMQRPIGYSITEQDSNTSIPKYDAVAVLRKLSGCRILILTSYPR